MGSPFVEPLLAIAKDSAAMQMAGTIMLAIFGLCAIVWAMIIARLTRRQPLAPLWPRRQVPWSWWLVLLAFVLYILVTGLILEGAQVVMYGNLNGGNQNKSQQLTLVLAASAIGGFVSTLLTAAVLNSAGANKIDLGLDTRWFRTDLLLGLAGFLAVLPVVFLIKWLLLPFSQENHPLEQVMRNQPSPSMIFWITLVAVVAAPVVEEFLLRVVFQGWLERCFFRGAQPEVAQEVLVMEQPDDPTSPALFDASIPYAAPPRLEASAISVSGPLELNHWETAGMETEQFVPSGWRAAMPIVISSVLFAGMHFGHGIDPIPLFFLAVVLGWLYQRTHRLWPCVVLHTALNGLSMTMMFLAS